MELIVTDCLDWFRHQPDRFVDYVFGSPPNRLDWFVNTWEYCLAFKPRGIKPYVDWKAIAEPPKYTGSGHFRQRDRNGNRKRGSDYPQNPLARPRGVFYVTVGGGHRGTRSRARTRRRIWQVVDMVGSGL